MDEELNWFIRSWKAIFITWSISLDAKRLEINFIIEKIKNADKFLNSNKIN